MKTTLFVILSVVLFFGPTRLFSQSTPAEVEYEQAGYYQMKEVAPGVQKLIRTERRVYVYYPKGWEITKTTDIICGALVQKYYVTFRLPSGKTKEIWFRIFPMDDDKVFLFERPIAVFPKKVSESGGGPRFHETEL